MQYTVKEFSELVGVSTRAIRYYDEIGLLKPSFINRSGYRIYTDLEVVDLLLILAYKEAGHNLNEVCKLMQLSGEERIESLREILKILQKRGDELSKVKIKDMLGKIGGKHGKES